MKAVKSEPTPELLKRSSVRSHGGNSVPITTRPRVAFGRGGLISFPGQPDEAGCNHPQSADQETEAWVMVVESRRAGPQLGPSGLSACFILFYFFLNHTSQLSRKVLG